MRTSGAAGGSPVAAARRARSRRRVVNVLVPALVIAGLAAAPAPVQAAPVAPVAPASPPEGSIPDLAAAGWQPVLDENFNGNSLDESVWTVGEFSWDGLHTRDSVDVAGGNLKLTTYTDSNGVHRAGELRTGGLGMLEPSEYGFHAAYGYVEARMKFPDGPYSGSTFWMMSQNGNNSVPFGDPAADGPELDIVEHGNKAVDTDESDGDSDGDLDDDGVCDWPTHLQVPCSETLLSGGHWDGFEEDHKPLHTTAVKNPGYDPGDAAATSLQGNYHTYGMLWTPDGYRYYVDGEQTFWAPAGSTYTPEHVILATYVYTPDGGFPPGFTYGAKGDPANDVTLVDYVKVWQRPISEIPDQQAVAGRPLAVPFTVTDHAYSSTEISEPGSVRVTATSSNQAVVADSGIVVTGNGSADPQGSFQNGDVESGTTGWTFPDLNGAAAGTGNNATVWSTRSYTHDPAHTSSLHLSEVNSDATQVGRAEQTITGLAPDTTYTISGRYDLELGYTDTNSNGRPDEGEPFVEPGETETDGAAAFDLGIVDVDASRAGNQTVQVRLDRNGWDEDDNASWWRPRTWPEEQLKFTTGPDTTSVTFYISNEAYKGTPSDSDVSVDALALEALVPAQRTVSLLPADDAAGSTDITLTARDAADSVLGTETFTVDFARGSTLTNGDFEKSPLGDGWDLLDGDAENGRGADILVKDAFDLNRMLRLGLDDGTAADGYPVPAATIGTARQYVSGLTPGVPYALSFTGKGDGGDLIVGVQQHTGPGSQILEAITTTDWSTRTINFTPTQTTAVIIAFDWDGADGPSYVDDVTLVPADAVGPVASSWPPLADVQEQHVPSSSPAVVPFAATLGAGSQFTVTSSNPMVLPDANVAVASNATGDHRLLGLTPVPDRTGKATITVSYDDGAGPQTEQIDVVVSDGRLRNPGLERGVESWTLPSTAAITTTPVRTGGSALQVNATPAVTTGASLMVPFPTNTRTQCNTTWTVGGWARGTGKLTIRQPRTTPVTLGEFTWANPSDWTEGKVTFTSAGCFDNDSKAFEVVLEDTSTDGVAAAFDDLYMVHAPAIRTIRDMSIYQTQTTYQWNTRRPVNVGRVSPNSFWDPSATVASSNHAVLPPGNVGMRPELTDSGWPSGWEVQTVAGATTGRSDVTVTLAEPFAGQNSKTFTVTVNAGTNFNNGDFERELSGWKHGWLNDSYDLRDMRRETMPNPPPTDADNVIRVSSGLVGYRVRGLQAGVPHVVQANAIGDGSTLRAVAYDHAGCVDDDPDDPDDPAGATCVAGWGTALGSVTINSTTWAATPDLVFTPLADDPGTPGFENDVWIFVWDANTSGGAVAPSSEPCAVYAAGETCVDDIGVFVAGDVGL